MYELRLAKLTLKNFETELIHQKSRTRVRRLEPEPALRGQSNPEPEPTRQKIAEPEPTYQKKVEPEPGFDDSNLCLTSLDVKQK